MAYYIRLSSVKCGFDSRWVRHFVFWVVSSSGQSIRLLTGVMRDRGPCDPPHLPMSLILVEHHPCKMDYAGSIPVVGSKLY